MPTTNASNMSTLCLTWINTELRKEIDRREEQAVVPTPTMMERVTSSFSKTITISVAIMTGVPTIVARALGL